MRTLHTSSLLVLGVCAACSGSGSGSGSNGRTAALMLTATATATVPAADPLVVPLASGELRIATALFHVGDLEIEMRRSGEHHDGSGEEEEEGEQGENENEQGENEGEDGGDEHEDEHEVVDEIELPGPFTFDLTAPQTVIAEVPVVPGTFDRVEMQFVVTSDDPFLGASIYLQGTFVDGTTSTPFTLRSDFDGHTTVPIANGGITVEANAVVPVELRFDLPGLLTNLDFANADVEGGTITIDSTHNVALLFFFESGLHACAQAGERDD